MMKPLISPHELAIQFIKYRMDVYYALGTVDQEEIHRAYSLLSRVARIFICGNGGSASVAEHFSCDHSKGVRTDTSVIPEAISLSSNVSLITAIANDLGYETVFSNQLKFHNLKASDLVVAISSSGKSPNVVKAIQYAHAQNASTISMVGFDGGELKKIFEGRKNSGHALLHVDWENYGIVEDCHQILMHSIAQALRRTFMDRPQTVPF